MFAPISIPVNVCGNAIAVAGLSRAQCKGGASVKSNHREAAPATGRLATGAAAAGAASTAAAAST
ncbi:chaplin family protein [Actinomadura luteofluorescens]|uniref:chaplin family protein n=1 Tax=Actinomadura luteofluorescens TaxID=46163 RepID=UPI00362E082B